VRLVDEGNVVKENDGAMLMIQRIDPIYAEFTVTENDLGTVRKAMASNGMAVGREDSLKLEALVDVPADSARITTTLGNPSTQPAGSFVDARKGMLTFLDNTVQANTGTVKLRATVPNSDLFFWPGQFVNVRLILTVKKDAVLLPLAAQQIGQQGPYAFVVKEADVPDPQGGQTHKATIAELRPIVPGQRQGDFIVVKSGLEAGERVIVAGHMMVAPGAPVMVTNTTPPPQETAMNTK
jgi:multidrug efflux system membrane fusion protein